MSDIFTQEQLNERGWDIGKIKFFLGSPYGNLIKGWNKKKVKKVEKLREYHVFESIELYENKQKELISTQKQLTTDAISFLSSNKVTKNNHNCLLDNLENYKKEGRFVEEIIHFPQKQQFDKKDEFKIFTDGCLKVVGNKTFVSCAGWIQNSKGEVVAEFAKELDPEKMRNAYNFEIFGISFGLEIVKKLGLENIHCLTDSSGEAQIISEYLAGFTPNRVLELPEIYTPVLKTLEEIKGKICFIPREFNSHADELTKIHMKFYKEQQKEKINQAKQKFIKNGFSYDFQKGTHYFIHEKSKNIANIKDLKDNLGSNKWAFYPLYRATNKSYYNFVINMETKDFHLISKVKREKITKLYKGWNLTSKEGRAKMSKVDSSSLLNLAENLKLLTDNKTIVVNHISPGFNAVLDNLTPIPEILKEEYFELHKSIKNFDKIIFAPLHADLLRRLNTFVTNQSVGDEILKNEKLKF